MKPSPQCRRNNGFLMPCRRSSPFSIDVLLEPFLHALVESGRLGLTFRIAGDKHLKPIQPIDVYFEPRPLDETTDTFTDFVAAIDSPSDSPTSRPDLHPVTRSERPALNKLNVRVRKAGGWFGLIVGSIFFLQQAMDWIRFGRVNFMLVFWLVIMSGWLLRLTGTTIRRTRSVVSGSRWTRQPRTAAPCSGVERVTSRTPHQRSVCLSCHKAHVACDRRRSRRMLGQACTQNETTALLRHGSAPSNRQSSSSSLT